MLVLGREDLRKVVTVELALRAAREAFAALGGGTARVPRRIHLETPHGVSLVMPAFGEAGDAVGVKIVNVTPANSERGLPTVQGLVLLFDEATGTPRALLEGTYLTQVRTGAAIGLAADLLARPDAETVALFGAGATARTSLWAIQAVRAIREVRVCQPHPERFPAFAQDLRDLLGADCPALRRVSDPREAIRGADIVVTATTASTPVFPGEALEPGSFVGALGAYRPDTRELDTATIQRSRLIVDSRESALAEAGDVVIPLREGAIDPTHLTAELGEVLLGQAPGRESPDDIVVFKSVGNAIQDLTLAVLAYRSARESGVGSDIDL